MTWPARYRSRNKYGNEKVMADGFTFDSKRERNYYFFLKEKLEKGEISNLRLQVPYEIVPPVTKTYVKKFKRKPDEIRETVVQPAVHYIADFVYTDNATGLEEVVDVKSVATRKDKVYILKKKMMRAFNGIEILEV